MPSTSIIDLYNKSLKEVGFKGAVVHTRDLTPYYSEGNSGKDAKLVDEKAISALEEKLSTKRYGQGMGVWGAAYNNETGKKYSEKVKKG